VTWRFGYDLAVPARTRMPTVVCSTTASNPGMRAGRIDVPMRLKPGG